MRSVAQRFDQWAPHYDNSALRPVYEAAHAAVLGRVGRHARRPKRVLDVGCGTGRLLAAVADVYRGSVLVGVDLSHNMLSIARRDGRLSCARADAGHLPFVDSCFDLVVSTVSFRHWADHRAAIAEIGRVLAPGCVLGIADLFGDQRGGSLAEWVRGARLPDPLGDSLSSAGLRVLSAQRVAGYGPVAAVTVVMATHRAARKRRLASRAGSRSGSPAR